MLTITRADLESVRYALSKMTGPYSDDPNGFCIAQKLGAQALAKIDAILSAESEKR